MKRDKKEILKKAIQVLKDLNPHHFKDDDIKNISYSDKDINLKTENIDIWNIYLIDPIFDAPEFLVISDDSGEPLYYQNFNMIIGKIEKDMKGKYYVVS